MYANLHFLGTSSELLIVVYCGTLLVCKKFNIYCIVKVSTLTEEMTPSSTTSRTRDAQDIHIISIMALQFLTVDVLVIDMFVCWFCSVIFSAYCIGRESPIAVERSFPSLTDRGWTFDSESPAGILPIKKREQEVHTIRCTKTLDEYSRAEQLI